jgi:glucose-1-phosphate cytidylyltransferase
MRTYSAHRFRRFILCTGYRSDVVKSYFLNYSSMNSDLTVNLKRNHVKIHSVDHDDEWEVAVAYTGEETMTGGALQEPRISISAMQRISL